MMLLKWEPVALTSTPWVEEKSIKLQICNLHAIYWHWECLKYCSLRGITQHLLIKFLNSSQISNILIPPDKNNNNIHSARGFVDGQSCSLLGQVCARVSHGNGDFKVGKSFFRPRQMTVISRDFVTSCSHRRCVILWAEGDSKQLAREVESSWQAMCKAGWDCPAQGRDSHVIL